MTMMLGVVLSRHGEVLYRGCLRLSCGAAALPEDVTFFTGLLAFCLLTAVSFFFGGLRSCLGG
jgi:hypothetical protein